MKSQTAAEVVAACSLAREGWRPAQGDLLVISVADEEVGGTGAEWVCAERPDLVRCDSLLNEGTGIAFPVGDKRAYDVTIAEKGVYRFTISTDGVAGHASLPGSADNALLKLAPLLAALAERQPGWDVTPGARALLHGLGVEADGDPAAALAQLPRELALMVEPLLRATLAPTMVDASPSMNVIPEEARLHVDCRVPPGMPEREVLARVRDVLGPNGYRLDVTERVPGNGSEPASALMDALRDWIEHSDPGALCLPTVDPGFSDSVTFREAFPDCVAYGFFPQRHMTVEQVTSVVHARDERVDVRDLALAVDCYRSVTRSLLG